MCEILWRRFHKWQTLIFRCRLTNIMKNISNDYTIYFSYKFRQRALLVKSIFWKMWRTRQFQDTSCLWHINRIQITHNTNIHKPNKKKKCITVKCTHNKLLLFFFFFYFYLFRYSVWHFVCIIISPMARQCQMNMPTHFCFCISSSVHFHSAWGYGGCG